MVHNGIEYGDMQLIAETYDIMRRALGMPRRRDRRSSSPTGTRALRLLPDRDHRRGARYIDPDTGQPLVDLILDTAEQKGTGRWTSQNALELATPIPTIDAAVMARNALRAAR